MYGLYNPGQFRTQRGAFVLHQEPGIRVKASSPNRYKTRSVPVNRRYKQNTISFAEAAEPSDNCYSRRTYSIE